MLKLIVNADDFGFSENVNYGIIKSFREGIVTSTSVMPNGKAFNHAVELAKRNLELDVGIHLTLTGEKPILLPNRVSSLVNNEGKFLHHARHFSEKYFLHKIDLDEVNDELDAQINTALNSGLQISHIDSHQHVHMLPKILKIVLNFSRKYKIPFVRFPKEHLKFSSNGNHKISGVLKVKLLNALCNVSKNAIPSGVDYFTGFFFDGNLNEGHLMETLKKLPSKGTCELMCHPGLTEGKQTYKNSSYHSEQETNGLISQRILDFLSKKEIELISFKKIYSPKFS